MYSFRRLAALLFLLLPLVAFAAPSQGPALETFLSRAQPEPPGPSSRRTGITISEVMYHPADRADGLQVEFIELFNSLPWFEELDGWRITGSVNYTFPSNSILPGRGYLVIAVNPDDLKKVTGLTTNVFGPFDGNGKLPDNSGRIRLWNRNGGLCLEMEYRDDGDYPVAADGTGHSLVLARPSYGERNPKAWSRSARLGGSPGTEDPAPDNSLLSVVINEIHAAPHLKTSDNPTDPDDFIELFNHSDKPLSLSGWTLSDSPNSTRFQFTSDAEIGPGGFVTVTGTQLGFRVDPTGDRLLLRAADGTVIDAVRYGPQSPLTSIARFPDGAPVFSRVGAPTPNAPNAARLLPPVVINEIMYHPPSEEDADEFLELHNPGSVPVDLSGWRLSDGIGYEFPAGSEIAGRGYIVIGRNTDRLRSNYPGLNPAVIYGPYEGALGNGGEHLALSMPVALAGTNKNGTTITRTVQVVVDEVSYGTGGRWGKWADGGGSSLERRNPRSDGRLAGTWADSDETSKSPWVTVEATGRLDNGNTSANTLQVIAFGAGEFLLDNVEATPAGSTNRVLNPTFETSATNWFFQGNHNGTSLESSEGDASTRSLHFRATGAGNTGANRVYAKLNSTLSPNVTATLRARVRWLKGAPNMLLRLRGNWLEAPGQILAVKNLGTPGARNTAFTPNTGPAIHSVTHYPILPAANQEVRVVARVEDPDAIGSVTLRWRRDTTTNLTDVAMVSNGGGWFSAVLPPQASAAMVAFHVAATDAADSPATSLFPSTAPVRECLVRWGEAQGNVALGPYRIWATRDTINTWSRREKLSNDPLDSTFVVGNYRVIYNAGAQYSGSPYHAPSYNTPTGNPCDYVTVMPADDAFLGEQELNLLQPGNGGGDGTGQQEQHAYWIARQLGLPYCHRRPVQLYVNGTRRGSVYDDAQQPNSDFVDQWFHDDADGDLHKIQLWFEFETDASTFTPTGADLGRYVTTGNVKKMARYRWNWPRRSYGNFPNNYTNLYNLVETVNTNVTGDRYARTLLHGVDVNNWFRTHVTEHIVGNNDSYSYGGGQNMYAYKPTQSPWKLLIWDIDFAFAAQPPNSDMMGIGGANVGPRNDVVPFNRLYWQAMIDAVNGPLLAERSNPIIDSRYNGMRTNGGNVSSGANIKSFVSQRRTYILSQWKANTAPFRVTSNNGSDFTTDQATVGLAGTAPLEVGQILANGVPLQISWTSRTAWTARLPLATGTNALVLTALDFHGQPITNDPVRLNIQFTGVPDAAPGKIVFNEVMHHPPNPGTGYVELRNLSSTTAFDLSGWRIDGLDFTFPGGTLLDTNGYLVVAEDDYQFADLYGPAIRLGGTYPGRLSRYGETLRLVRPGTPPEPDLVVDEFTYRTSPPWPAAANNGSSLQLVDPTQDNNRPGNWAAATTNSSSVTWQRVVATGTASSSAFYLYLENAGDAYIDDIQLVAGSEPETGPNLLADGDFEGAFPGAFGVSPNLSASSLDTSVRHSGKASLKVVASAAGSTRTSAIYQDITPALVSGDTYTLSFWYLPANTSGVLTLRLSGSGIRASTEVSPTPTQPSLARYTPGAINNVGAALAPIPPLWLNELQPVNLTGIGDNSGKREPWVEIYNAGDATVKLADFYLGNSSARPAAWRFPATAEIPGRSYRIVWLDGEPAQTTATEWHSSIRADTDNGLLTLSQVVNGKTTVLDYIVYSQPVGERTFGYLPDGDASSRRLLGKATPGGPNTLAVPTYPLFINEWMSDNAGTLRDPADNDFEDWFELFNAGAVPIDLTGFLLSDSRTNTAPFEIPGGYVIPPGGYLLVWADGEPGQNLPGRPDLHVDFKLSASGESIVLRAPDGTLIDAVDFGAQNPNSSSGRTPDGSPTIDILDTASPRGANPEAHPEILSVLISDDSFGLTWSSIPDRSYVVERSDGSPDAAPTEASPVLKATGSVLKFTETIGNRPAAYYRIKLLP